MKLYISLVLVFMLSILNLSGDTGRLLLTNGYEMKGDIECLEDGSYSLVYGNGSVKFEKDEVRKVIIDKKQKKNKAHEAFINALRITPGQSYPAGSGPSTPYDDSINKAASKHSVDPALIKAVIKAESNFNPNDKSYKGACGLMQLMPGTARILGVRSIFSPDENISAGTHYLKDMLYMFDGDVEKALAAYNAGPTVVARYKTIPPYRETKAYVKTVQKYYRKYKKSQKVLTFTDDKGCLNIYNVK